MSISSIGFAISVEEGNKEGGYVFAFGTINKTDVEGSEALVQARQLGQEIR
jgi:hypothetical protein